MLTKIPRYASYSNHLQKLRRVLLDDELGICADLECDMDELVGTYFDEWKAVVDDQERQRKFRQFVNTASVYLCSIRITWLTS